MKTLKEITLTMLLACSAVCYSQVGINTTTPNAQLDVRSVNQAAPSNTDGMLIPKIDAFPAVNPTAAQQGMLVYLTTASGLKPPGFYYWDNTTTNWIGIGAKAGWELSGNTGTSPLTEFVGTKDNQPLAFRTNNTEKMRIDEAGFTGIGTTTPKNKLHVMGTATGMTPIAYSMATLESEPSSYLSILSTQETGVIFGGNGNAVSGGIIYNSPGLPEGFQFRTAGNQIKMILASNGNLGLGGNSLPNFPLQFNSILGDKISLWGTAGNHYGFGIQNSLMQIHSNGPGADIAFGYGTSAAFTETMRIKGTGNVGIGTANPLSKLHIWKGNSGMTPNPAAGATVEGTGFTFMNILSDSETGVLFGSNGFHTNGGIVYNSGIYANGMNFRTGGNLNRMSISQTGNVSIGDVLADARLHIVASNQAAPANNDGIIIPRVNAFPAVSPTAAQNGMMVFLTTAFPGKLPGFYYWDNASASWKGVGTGTNWSMTGNAGTNSSVNFIGTTDNQDLIFKRNNITAGQLGATATGFGTSALANNTAAGSTAVGNNAMLGNTWGLYNSAFGAEALHTNMSGWYNTATGYNALYYNTASYNTANGVNALLQNTTGESNSAFGFESLRDNTDGHHNTAIGWGTMAQNQSGEQNTAVGAGAMSGNSAGTHNVAVGMNSLASNSSGISNTAIGTGAMFWHAGGNNNVALGMEAMNNQTSGSNNIAVGKGANVPSLTGSDQLSIGNVIYGTGMNAVATAKIGIADSAPDAKFEIAASNSATPANTDGILIPRVSAFPVANPTAAQNGMMVFLTNTIGGYASGFYYWDNAAVSWIPVGGKTGWSATGNSGTSPSSNFIGTNDNAAFAMRTNGIERVRVLATGDVGIGTTNPGAELEVNGFTKLGGSTAPAIKVMKLTSTTAVSQGTSILIPHGVSGSKILEVSAMVEYTSGSFVPQSYLANAGYEFYCYINGAQIVVINKSGNSANILNKPIKVMVTYEE